MSYFPVLLSSAEGATVGQRIRCPPPPIPTPTLPKSCEDPGPASPAFGKFWWPHMGISFPAGRRCVPGPQRLHLPSQVEGPRVGFSALSPSLEAGLLWKWTLSLASEPVPAGLGTTDPSLRSRQCAQWWQGLLLRTLWKARSAKGTCKRVLNSQVRLKSTASCW